MQNANDVVFEYLIDQLRQQVTKKDVTSFNVSVQISDLDEVKQVIHNLQQHIAGKDDEIRALKDILRQQVNSNQCEDLAQEVQSLKNQLRDASALVAELQEDNIRKSEHISHLTGQVKELHLALVKATGDAEAYKLIREQEQSGCRKEDAQGCAHNWIIAPGLFIAEGHKDNVPGSRFCCECGKREWDGLEYGATACTQECKHHWVLDEKGDYFVCAKCGEQEAELVDCQHINTVGLRKGFAPGFTKKCLDCGAKLK